MSLSTDRRRAPGGATGVTSIAEFGKLNVWEPIAVLVLLATLAVTGAGWFSADEVPVAQQVGRLASDGTWSVDVDPTAAAVDPDHRFHLLARSDRIEGEVVPYAKHPLYPLLLWPFGAAGPARLPFAVAALAGVAGAVAVSASLRWSRPAFWMAVLGTTLPFHVGVLWAHAPAFGLTGLAALGLCRATEVDRRVRRRWMLVASVALALAVLLRTEALLLGVAVTVALLWRDRADLRQAWSLAVMPAIGAGLAFVVEPWLIELLAGPRSGGSALVATGRDLSVAGRISVLRIMLLEPSVTDAGRAVLRLLGLVLLFTGAGLARSRFDSQRVTVGISVGAVGCYGIAFGAGAAPGLLVAMPLVALAGILVVATRRSGAPVFVIAFGVFASLVVATSYDSGGGGDWGGRYLFVGIPLILVGLVPTLTAAATDPRFRPLLAAAALATLVVQAEVAVDHYSRGSTVEVVDAVAATAAAELNADPDAVVAVSDERLARFLYDRGLRGASFHVPAVWEGEFDELLDRAGVDRIVWIDLGSVGADRPGRLVETHGSVAMRTLVRR